jgi:anthranilate phosphoribosyltransferase
VPDALRGGAPDENARICEAVLAGEVGPVRDAVALNAAAALVVAGAAGGIGEGLARARESIDSGGARKALDLLREISLRADPARTA